MVRPATYQIASATCTSVDHLHLRTSCSPGTDGSIGCLLRWTVHRGMRPRTSIARLVAPPAPTCYIVDGYWGGSEKWETLYAASQEMDFDDELRKAATVSFKDTGGNNRHSLFFSVCRWESTAAHGGLPKLEGKIPWCHRVLGLHASPCSVPCYL